MTRRKRESIVFGVALALALSLLFVTSAHAQRAERAQANPLAFWQAVGDTTLVRLLREALAANGDLHAAAARVEEVRAARTDAALALAPTVTATAGYTRQRLPLAAVPGATVRGPDSDYWDAGVEASWEIDVFGRLRRGLRGQNALLGSSEADQRNAQVLVAAELARGYVELRGLQELLAVARQNGTNQERALQLTQQRLEAGRGNELDTERARAQLSLTRATALDLEAQVTAAQYRIAVLAGREPESVVAELETARPMPALPGIPMPASLDSLARRRPDVVAAERRSAAAKAFHGAAKADYLPRLSLVGGMGLGSSDLDRFGGQGTSRYAVGPVISWPLLNLGRVKAGADAARAQKEAAEAAHRQTVLRASEEIRTATVRYRTAHDRLRLLEDAAAASRRASELALLRFRNGAADFLQVLDADRTRLEAEAQLARARTETGTLLVALYRAFGAEWPGAERQ